MTTTRPRSRRPSAAEPRDEHHHQASLGLSLDVDGHVACRGSSDVRLLQAFNHSIHSYGHLFSWDAGVEQRGRIVGTRSKEPWRPLIGG